MIVRLFLAALLCVVCSSAYSCDAMRPCYANGRLLYDSAVAQDSFYARSAVRHRASRHAHRRVPEGLARVMAEGAGRAIYGPDLVSRARAYLGTNPTGWRRLWCARFMAMLAPAKAARLRNPNMAKAWLHAGPRLGGCRVGAIAVMARRGGGHVGVVTSCGPHGPTVVSGNHGHRVGEGHYSASRVLAYVSAS